MNDGLQLQLAELAGSAKSRDAVAADTRAQLEHIYRQVDDVIITSSPWILKLFSPYLSQKPYRPAATRSVRPQFEAHRRCTALSTRRRRCGVGSVFPSSTTRSCSKNTGLRNAFAHFTASARKLIVSAGIKRRARRRLAAARRGQRSRAHTLGARNRRSAVTCQSKSHTCWKIFVQ
jgi:hypothetical protein